jgi:hypothetical protein
MPPALTVVSCSVYSTLEMEAKGPPETSVDLQRTTLRYILENIILHNRRCENLKSYEEILGQQIVDQETHMTYRLACSSSLSVQVLGRYPYIDPALDHD